MKCSNCSEKDHPRGAMFCHSCGTPLKRSSRTPIKRTWEVLLLTTDLLFCTAASLYGIIGTGGDKGYCAAFGNAAIVLAALVYYFSVDEEISWKPRLRVYCAIPVLAALFLMLSSFLPDVWSITLEILVIALFAHCLGT